MTTHRAVVTAGHGDTAASAGAKKKPSPTYQDEPARSDASTKRSHLGIGVAAVASRSVRIMVPLIRSVTVHGADSEVGAAITSDVVD
jgi:hypothetical protein